jgi:agmatine deiminase
VIKLAMRATPSSSGTALASPKALGYRMPAEWEPHATTWLTWPRPDGISFPDKYDSVPPVFAELIRHLVTVEEVNINVWDAVMEETVCGILCAHHVPLERVRFHHFPSYEPWCRDHGPIFLVRDGSSRRDRAIVDWAYNAWGGKYPPFDLDDAIPQHVAQLRQLPLFSPGMILEGGSIEVNGCGSLLTTTSCLLNRNRNPDLDQTQIEQNLTDYLGIQQVLWLGEGIVGDDTDGHIDDLARFVNPSTIITTVEEDPADDNYSILRENLERLRGFRDLNDRSFRIVELPMPGVVEYGGQRLPATYANFYIANGLVLVPIYRHKNDRIALEILQREFSKHTVVGIDSTELIWGLGSFHCITQQEPAETIQ